VYNRGKTIAVDEKSGLTSVYITVFKVHL